MKDKTFEVFKQKMEKQLKDNEKQIKQYRRQLAKALKQNIKLTTGIDTYIKGDWK